MIGLDEVARLPTEEAIPAVILRTRQYASYQRKWMRRIPGAIRLDGERPSGDLAEEILAALPSRAALSAR